MHTKIQRNAPEHKVSNTCKLKALWSRLSALKSPADCCRSIIYIVNDHLRCVSIRPINAEHL